MYLLIFKSHKRAARRFTRWVTHQVLPSIRQTGGYGRPLTWLDRKEEEALEWIEAHGLDHASFRSTGPELELVLWAARDAGYMYRALELGDRQTVAELRKDKFRQQGRGFTDEQGRRVRYATKELAKFALLYRRAARDGDVEAMLDALAMRSSGLRAIDGEAGEAEAS